jgi:hypothetical protein
MDYMAEAVAAPLPADLLLVFGSHSTISNGVLWRRIQDFYPEAVVAGCSTGGQIINDKLLDDDAVILALSFDATQVRLAVERGVEPSTSRHHGRMLGAALRGDDLTGVFVLADGLRANGNELVLGVSEAVGPAVTIAGGMAADGGSFATTLVVAQGHVDRGQAIAIGLYGRSFRMQTGIGDGWQVFGPRRRVTKAIGNRLYALDGEPVLELYRRYLDDEDFAGFPKTGLLFPLQISDRDDPRNTVIRAVLDVDHSDGAVIFGGDLHVGSIAQLMRGVPERLVAGAAAAARQISAGVRSDTVGILVSCIGRRLLMGSRIEDEVLTIADELGSMPRVGFYSLGEICPLPENHRPRLHNETMTIITFSEEA